MLKVSNITIKSNTRTVINDVSLEVAEGEIVALLGPNGAGKSELVLGIAGVMPLESGAVAVDDVFLNGAGIQAIRSAGIAAVPEGHHVLGGLSVIDNLRAAGPSLSAPDRDTEVERAFTIFPELRTLSGQSAGSLSGGQQQMVAIAQALVSRPRFLLIDEMSLGLAPVIIDRLIGVIRDLRDRGIGILLIEQFTQLALDVADRCYVVSQGTVKFDGVPTQLKADQSILERAYLGA
ncbi:MAG: ATP-binding cassette domain-containing protein [Paracoccaceae bacterium]|uniref:ABC transporter ATP-binding protein n=1 Tax=Shimia thalassica TaxID=1715693 RepID=UPI0032977D6A